METLQKSKARATPTSKYIWIFKFDLEDVHGVEEGRMSWAICACPLASACVLQGRRPGLYLDRRARQLSSCSVMQLLSSHLFSCLRPTSIRMFTDHRISLVSFSQLQKQIIDLAATHFRHLPVRPPHEELAQVPHNLPSFLGDTPASRYVQYAPLEG